MSRIVTAILAVVLLVSCRPVYRLHSGLYRESANLSDVALPASDIDILVTDSMIAFIDTAPHTGDTVVTLAKYTYAGDTHCRDNYIIVNTIDEYECDRLTVYPHYSQAVTDSIYVTVSVDELSRVSGILTVEFVDNDSPVYCHTIHCNPSESKSYTFAIPQFTSYGEILTRFRFTPDNLRPFQEFNSTYFGKLYFDNSHQPTEETEFHANPHLDSLAITIHLTDSHIARFNFRDRPFHIHYSDHSAVIIIDGSVFYYDSGTLHNPDSYEPLIPWQRYD